MTIIEVISQRSYDLLLAAIGVTNPIDQPREKIMHDWLDPIDPDELLDLHEMLQNDELVAAQLALL